MADETLQEMVGMIIIIITLYGLGVTSRISCWQEKKSMYTTTIPAAQRVEIASHGF